MKRLNLLKPNIRSGYLNYGRGQEITYLQVPENINVKDLENDIEAGAEQFKELLDFARKKSSRFVVINCKSEEDGYMAVSYLSGIYNGMECAPPDEYDEDSVYEEMEFDDYEESSWSDYEDEDSDNEWEANSSWEENPWKIPIVYASSILQADQISAQYMFRGNVGMGTVMDAGSNAPYWSYARTENICIIYNPNPFFDFDKLCKKLKRYENNRHVFIINIENNTPYMDNAELNNAPLYEIILDYAAGCVEVTGESENRLSYYENVFENFVALQDYKLSKEFSTKDITQAIMDMDNPGKADLIEKVIKYVVLNKSEGKVLNEEDFNILSKFKALGAKADGDSKSSQKKLQDDLIGMDSVKEQINGILQIMRYNKRRKSMGLSTNNFHNVHLMLGAPGTAKTTVAQLLGTAMAEERLLPGNKFKAVNGAELKGKYVGHSAPKVHALFEEADIIFIDEAYAVASGSDGDNDSFSQEAIAQLIVELENHGMDKLVMFAGYGGRQVSEKDNKMKNFLNANPGIRSRINTTIFFDSYTPDEMLGIFKCHARIGEYTIKGNPDEMIMEFFRERALRDDFGNGREARSLLENSIVEAAKRLSAVSEDQITEQMMKTITKNDIEKAINKMKEGMETQIGKTHRKCGFAF